MTLQEQIRANRWRTLALFASYGLIVFTLGLLLERVIAPGILGLVGIVAIAWGIISYVFAGRIVASMLGARKLEKRDLPELYRVVENVSIAAGMDRTPDVYMVPDAAPNAFAAGRDPRSAYVGVTRGLIELMDERELAGVVAHELAHIRNRDVRLMSLAAILGGMIALASDILLRVLVFGGRRRGSNQLTLIVAVVALVLAPIAATMIQLALSRRREYLADASAAEITGDAEGLARALAKLKADRRVLVKGGRATAHMFIESPLHALSGSSAMLVSLFETHPPLERRIEALEQAGGFKLEPQAGEAKVEILQVDL